MSTIPRKFFLGALPRRPAASADAGAGAWQPNCFERIARARCVFAERINKGIFCTQHLRVANSAVSHRRATRMSERLFCRRCGARNAPTIGRPIRHRTSRFARKLRKLFWPSLGLANALDTPEGSVERRLRMLAGVVRSATNRLQHDRASRSGWHARWQKARRVGCRWQRRSRSRSGGRRGPETKMPARSNPAGIVCCPAFGAEPLRRRLSGLRLPAARRSRPGPTVR